ncbi:MAG TPA: 3-hexulose-6-phosphate synthase, partial [Candidatus Subteraquimicrobiales bacterium]
MKPVLQVALDFLDLPRALKVAEEAVAGGADWFEAGTPLIKSEGLEAVRALRKKYPKKVIVADMKIIDTGRIEVEAAAKAGANVVGVLGEASAATIRECIEAARNYGAKIMVDLIECPDVVGRAKEAEALGAHFLGVHAAIDVQMQGLDPFKELREVSRAVGIPVSVAGGINSETAAEAVRAGATVVVVGGAIIKSADARNAAAEIKKALRTGQKIETKLYKRGSAKNIREILEKVSASNVSDALHRGGEIQGIFPVTKSLRLVGRAITVRTYPGDWAKPVEAIDEAKEGDVIVIDAGGAGPAVWG